MAKTQKQYSCQTCGSVYPKWSGKCEACGEWNSLVEEVTRQVKNKFLSKGSTTTRLKPVSITGPSSLVPRLYSKILEFDRVCGGGVVPGSVLLIGGDPGVGKSTLLLQMVDAFGKNADKKCLYISGEESLDQIRRRAERLDCQSHNISLLTTIDVEAVIELMSQEDCPEIVIIDSIQTMVSGQIESAAGTVAQVRACVQFLIQAAKQNGITLFLVGHVTKEGMIAGPKVVEHMVDTVLYFEGDQTHQFRLLRSIKNRFGPAHEIGVFEMQGIGLAEVNNPSELFLVQRNKDEDFLSGSSIFAGIEGSRPILIEIQALVGAPGYTTPRRTVVGWDFNRLAMILAVLEKRCGINYSARDVYLNVVGGLKISETAADLAVASALISSFLDKSLPHSSLFFGEVGLSGEVRSVSHLNTRIKEAIKLGFGKIIMPKLTKKQNDVLQEFEKDKVEFIEINHVKHLKKLF